MRHADVHQHDLRAQALSQLHGGLAVGGLRDHRDVVLGVQQRVKSRPHERLVVDQFDGDHEAVGRRARTCQPPSAPGAASSVPPSATARSRIPRRPLPVAAI